MRLILSRLDSFRNYRKPGCFPCGEATGYFDEIGDAVLVEDADGDGGSIAAGTVDRDAAIAGDLTDAFLEAV